MNDRDLDQCYGALCQAMSGVGPDKAALFLAMLSLSLVSRADHATDVLALIEQARMQCGEAAKGGSPARAATPRPAPEPPGK